MTCLRRRLVWTAYWKRRGGTRRVRLSPAPSSMSLQAHASAPADWPTVLLAVPRAAVALVLILVLGTNSAAVAEAGIYGRDGAFFDSAGALTLFAFGTLLACVLLGWLQSPT